MHGSGSGKLLCPTHQVLERMEGRITSWPASPELPHAVHEGVDEARAQELLLRWDDGTAAGAERGKDIDSAAEQAESYLSDDDEDMFGGPRY